jgi:hypothetical protein
MKTIQLLILAVFLGTTTFTNAQDASNDATWEETIDFINKNVDEIEYVTLGSNGPWTPVNQGGNFQLDKNGKLKITNSHESYKFNTTQVDLKLLQSIYLYKDEIQLELISGKSLDYKDKV